MLRLNSITIQALALSLLIRVSVAFNNDIYLATWFFWYFNHIILHFNKGYKLLTNPMDIRIRIRIKTFYCIYCFCTFWKRFDTNRFASKISSPATHHSNADPNKENPCTTWIWSTHRWNQYAQSSAPIVDAERIDIFKMATKCWTTWHSICITCKPIFTDWIEVFDQCFINVWHLTKTDCKWNEHEIRPICWWPCIWWGRKAFCSYTKWLLPFSSGRWWPDSIKTNKKIWFVRCKYRCRPSNSDMNILIVVFFSFRLKNLQTKNGRSRSQFDDVTKQ